MWASHTARALVSQTVYWGDYGSHGENGLPPWALTREERAARSSKSTLVREVVMLGAREGQRGRGREALEASAPCREIKTVRRRRVRRLQQGG